MTAGDRSTRRFQVHGHHYALCDLTGLASGRAVPYRVAVDGVPVWPPAGSSHPPSLVRTLDPAAPQRLLFGSCRTPTDHGPAAVARYGADVLRAYALRLAEARRAASVVAAEEPTALLLIGDQVYADEIQQPMWDMWRAGAPAMAGLAASARDEVVFFDEYAELYRQSWSDPDVRWLLSTVPTLMLFDDHDIRGDWNTSGRWRQEIAENPWWRHRILPGWAPTGSTSMRATFLRTMPLTRVAGVVQRRRGRGVGRVCVAGAPGPWRSPVESCARSAQPRAHGGYAAAGMSLTTGHGPCSARSGSRGWTSR